MAINAKGFWRVAIVCFLFSAAATIGVASYALVRAQECRASNRALLSSKAIARERVAKRERIVSVPTIGAVSFPADVSFTEIADALKKSFPNVNVGIATIVDAEVRPGWNDYDDILSMSLSDCDEVTELVFYGAIAIAAEALFYFGGGFVARWIYRGFRLPSGS